MKPCFQRIKGELVKDAEHSGIIASIISGSFPIISCSESERSTATRHLWDNVSHTIYKPSFVCILSFLDHIKDNNVVKWWFIQRITQTPLMRSGMAHVNEGSYSFTCHRRVYPRMEWSILPLLRISIHQIAPPGRGTKVEHPITAY